MTYWQAQTSNEYWYQNGQTQHSQQQNWDYGGHWDNAGNQCSSYYDANAEWPMYEAGTAEDG